MRILSLSVLAIATSLFSFTSLKAEALPQNAPAIAQSLEDFFSSSGFIMPSKNIYCVIYGDRLRCEIVSQLNPMPPQPESCNNKNQVKNQEHEIYFHSFNLRTLHFRLSPSLAS